MKYLLGLGLLSLACGAAHPLSTAEVKSLPPFQATVVAVMIRDLHHSGSLTIRIELRRDDGLTVVIEEPKATFRQLAFASCLRTNRVYWWPQVFADFARKSAQRPQYKIQGPLSIPGQPSHEH